MWLVSEDVNHSEHLVHIKKKISLFYTENVIFEHLLFTGIMFKIV